PFSKRRPMASVVSLQRAIWRHRTFYLEAIRDPEAVTRAAVVDPDGGTFAEARGVVATKPLRTYGSFAVPRRRPNMVIATFTAGKGWRSCGPSSPPTTP